MSPRTYGKLFYPIIWLKKVLRLSEAWGKVKECTLDLLPWYIWRDVKSRSEEIENNVNETFNDPSSPEELAWYTEDAAPKGVVRLLLSSAQDFGRIYLFCWLVALLQWLVLYGFYYVTGVGNNSLWAKVIATIAMLINVAIVLIAWWLAIALTATLGADGLHIVAFHNVGSYRSAKLGFFSRYIAEVINFTIACKNGETCSQVHWLNIKAHLDKIARSYAMFGFIRLLACYLLGIFAFGLTCSWWTWVLGNGNVVKDFGFNNWAWLDMAYFLSISAVTIGYGDMTFVGYMGKVLGWALSGNLLLNVLFVITWYHTYAFSFKDRLFAGVCNKAQHPDWLETRSILY